jgi:hypothetical protein
VNSSLGDDDYVTAAEKEEDLVEEYLEHVFGEASDDEWAAKTPISSAYLKIKNIAGLIDITAELNGGAVAVGKLVKSDKSDGSIVLDDTYYGLTVGLAKSVVPGLTANILVVTNDGDPPDDENFATYSDELDAADPIEWGLQLIGGYVADLDPMKVGGMVKAGSYDLANFGTTIVLGIEPTFALSGDFSVNVDPEFNILLRGSGVTGIGIGVPVKVSIMGITPSVKFLYKTADYYGDGSLDATDDVSDDIEDEKTVMDEFDTTDLSDAMVIEADVAVDLATIMGMKLVTLGAGFDFYNNMDASAPYTVLGFSYNVGLDLSDVLGMPIKVAHDGKKYGDNNYEMNASVSYTAYEILTLMAKLDYDADEEFGLTLSGKVSF